MPRSTRSFLFPDVNVWVALTYERHIHHPSAREWFHSLDDSARLFFCRLTQLSFLRLITAEAVMGPDEVRTQEGAWAAYDRWLEDERISFLDEPPKLESFFRGLTSSRRAAPKAWTDSYLAAFASAAQLALVTFDHDFRSLATSLILLRG